VNVSARYPQRVKFNAAGEDFEIKLRLAGDGRGDGREDSRFLLSQLENFLDVLGSGEEKRTGAALKKSPEVVTGHRIEI